MEKVYLAGSFNWQERIRDCAEELKKRIPGLVVTSEWLHQEPSFTRPKDNSTITSQSTWDHCQILSERDIRNILEADTLILFEPDVSPERNTRVAEFGGALFSGKQCIVIGPENNKEFVSNIFVKFHKVPSGWGNLSLLKHVKPVVEFPNWKSFLESLV